jgi:voltage-gated potassium channel
MKVLGALLASLVLEQEQRQNLRALLRFLLFLLACITVYSVLFHVIMTNVEGRDHSWLTGFYWTLTVMSTLGFGDITFESDLGRAFSILVLMSGIVLLLIVLPFVFIRSFYAPWLEARLRLTAPRKVPSDLSGHVLLCGTDSFSGDLILRLSQQGIPYRVLVEDPALAASMHQQGIQVLSGAVDSAESFEAAGAARARMVVANQDDPTNTNIVLTVREVAPHVPIVALAENYDSVDILSLSGADHVLQLKRHLGEQLAQRVNAGYAQTHVIGSYRGLLIAEFPIHNTPLVGRTIRGSGLREIAGVTVVGIWEHARLQPADPDTVLKDLSFPVVVGTEAMMQALDEFLCIYDVNVHPVLVIGGGKVGRAATRALKRKGIPVHMVEKDPALASRFRDLPDRLITGDAARREVLAEAGLDSAPTVLLTTNDDAVNLYLCVYCRRLNPETRIVSRITHQRNVPSIRRAGADLALSYGELGVESIYSLIQNRSQVILGQGVELSTFPLPAGLEGSTLAESGIGASTGVNVIAVETPDGGVQFAQGSTPLSAGDQLVVIANHEQMERFREVFKGKLRPASTP